MRHLGAWFSVWENIALWLALFRRMKDGALASDLGFVPGLGSAP